jgi:hypothetical protein
MAVPTAVEYLASLKVAAANLLVTEINAGAGNGWMRIYDAADVALAFILFDDPAGTVDANGVITLTVLTQEDAALASGTAAYAEVQNPDNDFGDPIMRIPVVEGAAAVPGYLVLASTTIVIGEPVSLISAVIG